MRTRTVSSSGLAQEHHFDSYPDTEEESDLSDNDHESVSTNTTVKQPSRKQFPISSSSRVSGSSTPLISPAGGKTFDEHVQKVPQTLNLEHLQDSLRRSLSKGSDNARTPVASSPAAMDNNEREKMVIGLNFKFSSINAAFLFIRLRYEGILPLAVQRPIRNTHFVSKHLPTADFDS